MIEYLQGRIAVLEEAVDLIARRYKELDAAIVKQDKEIEDLNTVVQDLLGHLGKGEDQQDD